MTADKGKLIEIAAAQRGLFTRRQARDCGFTDYQVRRRLRDGQWQVFLGSVLASAGVRRTPAVVDRAAWLAVPGSILAGPSAARLHGIPVVDSRPWLAVPGSAHPRAPAVQLLRGPLSAAELFVVDGMIATDRARTIFDCLRALPERAARDLLDRALQQQWITLDDLTGRVRGFVGRHGIGKLVRLTAGVGCGTRSVAERRAADLLRQGGLHGWAANVPICDPTGALIGVGDVVFAAERVVVELDGQAYHVSLEQFQRDRHRQNRLIADGWQVLRFTWRDVTRRPEYVTAIVRRVVEERRRVRRG